MVDAAGRRRAADELTHSQKACLRLVKLGLTSKEIARKTGLSPQTVDQYMSRAAARLGVTNRYKAADLLTATETAEVNISELRTPEVAEDRPSDPSHEPPAGNEGDEGNAGEEGPKRFLFTIGELLKDLFQIPPVGGRRHALGGMQRTAVVIRIALTALVAVSALVAITRGAIFLLNN